MIDVAPRVMQDLNRDDVVSTHRLRSWLEQLRATQVGAGVDVPRPTLQHEEKEVGDRAATAEALRAVLLDGVPPEAAIPGHPQHERWLLAYLKAVLKSSCTAREADDIANHVCNWAIGRDLLTKTAFHPRGVRIPAKSERRRERRVSEAEEQRLLEACKLLKRAHP